MSENLRKDYGVLCVKNKSIPVGVKSQARGEACQNFWHGASLIQMHFLWCAIESDPEISRHKTLSALQKYLEVLDEDKEAVIATLKF